MWNWRAQAKRMVPSNLNEPNYDYPLLNNVVLLHVGQQKKNKNFTLLLSFHELHPQWHDSLQVNLIHLLNGAIRFLWCSTAGWFLKTTEIMNQPTILKEKYSNISKNSIHNFHHQKLQKTPSQF